MLLFTTSSSTARLNGIQRNWIRHQRGLRQGDPLSPYLFILTIDTLHHIMCKETQDGLITPRRDRAARLRLSLYADDAVIFINPVKEDFGMIMALMMCFDDATRLRINVNKSSVAPIRYSQVNLDEVL
jgi:hypothetical protein